MLQKLIKLSVQFFVVVFTMTIIGAPVLYVAWDYGLVPSTTFAKAINPITALFLSLLISVIAGYFKTTVKSD